MVEVGKTSSICPVCLKRVPARLDEQDLDVYLTKECPEHGVYRVIVWEGPPAFRSWKRPKIPTTPRLAYRQVERGCPFDCGLCPEHRQRSCTIILEVTERCNLSCPFCYADSGRQDGDDPDLGLVEKWYGSAAESAGDCNIQLSGGEPTLRDDLPAIVRLGRAYGFSFIQINTNGLRLARDEGYVEELKSAGLDSVFLQFDGLDQESLSKIRGRDLVDEKLTAIDTCGRHGIGVVLVPTLVPGLNTGQIGRLVKKALDLVPVVRAIHFQPVSYFGRFPEIPTDGARMTLPRLMRSIEEQTDGLIKAADFKPPGCENALCSFHANYLALEDGGLRLLGGGASCCPKDPESAEIGAARTISRVAKQWSAPQEQGLQTMPTAPRKTVSPGDDGPISLDDFLSLARSNTFSVSAMAFQDVWNVDMERLRDCCIHIMTPKGELVPFCAYNLTALDGKSLYR